MSPVTVGAFPRFECTAFATATGEGAVEGGATTSRVEDVPGDVAAVDVGTRRTGGASVGVGGLSPPGKHATLNDATTSAGRMLKRGDFRPTARRSNTSPGPVLPNAIINLDPLRRLPVAMLKRLTRG